MNTGINRLLKGLGVICLAWTLATPVIAQEKSEPEPPANIQLAGKVPSLIKRSKVAEVAGKKHDFRRLIGDDAQHDALMRKLAEPMTDEQRKELHAKQLARYGSKRTERRTQLTDYGSEFVESSKKRVARSAAEPEEESSSLAAYIIMSILATSVYVLYRNR